MSHTHTILLAALAALPLTGCLHETSPVEVAPDHELGHLAATPATPSRACPPAGRHTVEVDAPRKPIFYLPPSRDRDAPLPLVVLYHGAGGNAEQWASPYEHADRLGLALLIMQSRQFSWDVTRGGWGPDVATTDEALEFVFDRCVFDPTRIAMGGFSDGASYALSLGLKNPALVRQIIAFSPGFEMGERLEPRARVFISHGTQDPILPIRQAARPIVASLMDAGYDVEFVEFEGGHEVPPEISRAAFDWLLPPD